MRVRAVLDRLGRTPSETAFVGDSQVDDIQGAASAGLLPILKTQLLRPQASGAWAMVRRLSEVSGLFSGR